MKKYNIGEVSKILGLSQHTLRYYEKLGIIEVGRKGSGGVREYTLGDLQQLEYVKALKDIGLSLEEIKTYTVLKKEDERTLRERRDILEEHRERVKEQINFLLKIRKDIDEKIECIDRRLEK